MPLVMATVIVELPPSPASPGCADTVHVGASLAEIVTVAEPMDSPSREAVIVAVSSPSTKESSVAETMAVAEVAPASRVNDVAESDVVGSGNRSRDTQGDRLVVPESLAVGDGHRDGGAGALGHLRRLGRYGQGRGIVGRYGERDRTKRLVAEGRCDDRHLVSLLHVIVGDCHLGVD